MGIIGSIAFQFHKGTIRTLSTAQGITDAAGFQFHKGTIRTITNATTKSYIQEFQFHKGTIRTIAYHSRVRAQPHFNSIKVRLEHS